MCQKIFFFQVIVWSLLCMSENSKNIHYIFQEQILKWEADTGE